MTSIRLKLVERVQTAAVIFFPLTNIAAISTRSFTHCCGVQGLLLHNHTVQVGLLVSSGGLSLRVRAAACVATTPSRFEPLFWRLFDSVKTLVLAPHPPLDAQESI